MTRAGFVVEGAPDSPAISAVAYETYAPEFGRALLAYKVPLGQMTTVDHLTKELVRLRNAHINGCNICSNFRNPKALEAGLDEDLVTAVDDPTSDALDRRQRAAVGFAEAFLLCPFLDDATKTELSELFTPAQLVEIILSLISWSANKSTVLLGVDYQGDDRLQPDLAAIGTDFL